MFRNSMLAMLTLALAGCTTASAPKNALETRWVGKSAGTFFAAYGPPLTDIAAGSSTKYTWRGGFRGARVCAVELVVGSDYAIQTIRATRDHAGKKAGQPSHCEETLDAAK